MTGSSVADLDDEFSFRLQREILIERCHAEKPRFAHAQALCDMREHLCGQVAVMLLYSLQYRNDVLFLAADAVDYLIDLMMYLLSCYAEITGIYAGICLLVCYYDRFFPLYEITFVQHYYNCITEVTTLVLRN